MHPETGPTASPFYLWKPESQPVSVQLQFDVVDRILLEVMRGFGAVPKRGAEVGGILLGTAERTHDGVLVKVEDFEPVECDHASGPSYILSDEDRADFAAAVERWKHGPDRRIYAVGYYRGHTRDGVNLGAEDLSLLQELFPEPTAIALIVKPYATKVSVAGIFFREEGVFKADASHLEFPFRRKELGGGSSGMDRLASAARFGQQQPPREGQSILDHPLAASDPFPPAGTPPRSADPGSPAAMAASAPGKSIRGGWVWIPLSFIFMLLGTVIGFQIALSMRPKQATNPWLEAWGMSLAVSRSGEQLQVNWDPLSPAIRNSNRGALIIQSAAETRTIELSGSQLQGGSVIYKTVPDRVLFRLEVYPRERILVSEFVEFTTTP